jgi:hypothetical protein
MAKHTLNSTSNDLDFVLIGITCPENQYSMVSCVNDVLNIELQLENHVPFNLKGGKLFYFSLFAHENEDLGLEYFLISNTSNLETEGADKPTANDLFADTAVEESTRLVKELPKTDYFLILKGEELHMFQYKIIDLLKTIPEVVQVQSIEPTELPSRMNLVF